MASWIDKHCRELLKKLNDIPFEDNREERQVTLLMAGVSQMTREMMRRAAENARASLSTEHEGGLSSESVATKKPVADPAPVAPSIDDVPDLDDFDSFDEELDLIEQTLIRSIGD